MAAAKKTSAKKSSDGKSTGTKNATKAGAKNRGGLAGAIRTAGGGRPLGATLEALLALAPDDECLRVNQDAVPADRRKAILELYNIVALGRSAQGFFGPLAHHLSEPLDRSPIAHVHGQGAEPEIVAANLAEYLSLWAFVPSHVALQAEGEQALQDRHEDHFADREDDDIETVRQVLALPGVRKLASGEEARDVLDDCPELSLKPQPRSETPDIEAKAKTLFREHVGRAKLLVELVSIQVEDDEVTALISVIAPREVAPKIIKHPSVDRPLRAFRSELREELPDNEVKLAFVARPASPDAQTAMQSLALGLRHAGASDLVHQLQSN